MQNDIDIFREIKSEIQINPENFKPAGQWLDGLFPNESGFIKPMVDAFTKADCEYPRDSRKFMLIAWLLTDKYLSESKLGITKYGQYAFNHEIIEPEGNRLPQTEQEMAKDAVFARPDAMEIIRDAYLSYKGLLPGESIGTKAGKTNRQKTESKQFLVLRKFIEIHCDLSANPDVQSKAALLHEYNLKGKIKLPKLAHKYRKGQHKYYYVDDLRKHWPTYQKKMPTLPPLKVAGN